MEVLKPSECIDWLKSHEYKWLISEGAQELTWNGSDVTNTKYQYPKDSGKKVALARLIYKQCSTQSSLLIWVRNWNVWPSSCHLPLLIRLRQALNETKLLEETPGHLFTGAEEEDCISIIVLGLEFYWDCVIAGADNSLACFLSNDECYTFASDKKMIVSELEKRLVSGKWGVKL